MVNRRMVRALTLGAMTLVFGCTQASPTRVALVKQNSTRQRTESSEFRTAGGDESQLSQPDTIQKTGGEEPVLLPGQTDETSTALRNEIGSQPAWTLADLEALALAHNPTLSQAAAAVDQQQGQYRQSGLYPNPQVGYLNTTANHSDPRQANGIFVSQELVTAKKIPLAQAANLQEIRRLQWDQEAQQIRVLNDVRIRYYEVLGAQRAVAVNQQLEQLSGEHLNAAKLLFEGKTVSKADVLQAQVLVEGSRLSLAEATHRLEAAWAQLASMVGVPSLPVTQLSEEAGEALPELNFETQWQQMLAESPQLRSAESELDHGKASLREANAAAIPNVTLQVVADYDRVTQSTTASTLVALPIPIYNRNQGNIDQARADVRADQADIVRTRLVLRDQLAESFQRFRTSRMQAVKLRETILPALEENLHLAMVAYQAGEIGFRDVLSAQQAFAHSQIAHLQAVTDTQQTAVEITGLQLTGGLNPAAIGSAIQTQRGGGGQRRRALLQEVQDRATKQLLPAAQIGR